MIYGKIDGKRLRWYMQYRRRCYRRGNIKLYYTRIANDPIESCRQRTKNQTDRYDDDDDDDVEEFIDKV